MPRGCAALCPAKVDAQALSGAGPCLSDPYHSCLQLCSAMGKRARASSAKAKSTSRKECASRSQDAPDSSSSVMAHDTQTLVGQAEVAGAKRRPLKPQKTEEQVGRMLYDHFRDLDPSSVDGRFHAKGAQCTCLENWQLC